MADQIDTVEIDLAEQQEREQIGTWDYSKQLLVKCESDGKYKEEEKPSKNALNIYKVMVWLEKKNGHIIKNHAINRHSRIVVPKELKDFIRIIGEETPIDSECKQTQGEYEINYEDCMIFQHEQYPGKDKKDKNKVAEDIMSGDMSVEKIVEKNLCLEDRFHEVLHFKNVIKTEAENLKKFKIPTTDSEVISNVQGRIESILKEIVECAKQEMKGLMELCSVREWQELAMKMYDRFCSGDGSEYKDDLLNKLFTEHEKTKTCIKDFRERFEEYIKKYNYDIVSFNILVFHDSVYGNNGEEGISRQIFGDKPQLKKILNLEKIRDLKKIQDLKEILNLSELKKIPEIKEAVIGSMICFHDTQGFNVYAEDVKIKNGKFSCKLRFDFYDHFGLDSGDLESFGDIFLVGKGFQSWYLLQHLNEYPTGCKAFVDHAIHEEMLEIEIEQD